MIELWTANTGNGRRPLIMLEECGLPNTLHRVDLMKGEQKSPAFLAMNPAGAIPVLKDGDVVIAQSGAIVLYLADKTGTLMPKDAKGRAAALQWLMFACTDAAPASSGIFYVGRLPEPPAAALKMFEDKLMAHFAVADARIGAEGWLAGKDITVADIAFYPIVQGRQAMIDKAPGLAALKAWAKKMSERPAVKKTYAALPAA